MRSPLIYMGGKGKAVSLLMARMPAHDRYAEPFAGGAAVFFAKPLAADSHLNDANADVLNVLSVIRDRLPELRAALPQRTDKDTFHRLKAQRPEHPVRRAARWWYLNRHCYSGIMSRPNWSSTKTDRTYQGARAALDAASAKLGRAELTCGDFEGCIDALPDGTFCYVDPPYFGGTFNLANEYYADCFDGGRDHERLAAVLARNAHRLSILLSYNDTEGVRALYPDWETEPVAWRYYSTRPRRLMGRELLLANYTYARQGSLLEAC